MNQYRIRGGRKLHGEIAVHGSKNSVLPILAASLMAGGQSVISNCPKLSDIEASNRILNHLGCHAYRENDKVIVDSTNLTRTDIPNKLMREMRSSVVFLGGILARMGEACMSFPGGCELGPRPIDLHINSLRQLGAEILEERGNLICKAKKLYGCDITLTLPSVGATENIMLAACAAEGRTRIMNAAREPEIVDLQEFLKAMGARISGAGSSTVCIEGGYPLHEANHKIIADRIVAVTYMTAVAVAGGSVRITNCNPEHFDSVTAVLSEAGCEIRQYPDGVFISREKQLRAMRCIHTIPYPGFPTDAQSPVMAVAAYADGTTVFVENMYENRYRHAGEMLRMGADIKIEGRVAVVSGVPKLYGAELSATDLRGGAALVVAALGAEGESHVNELRHIDRGYDSLEQALASLGADIKRI